MKKTLLFTIIFAIGFSIPSQAQTTKDYIARVALNLGWTIKIGTVQETSFQPYYIDYLENVKQGLSWGGNAQFNINNLFTIGLFYDRFTKSATSNLVFQSNGHEAVYTINNTYTMEYMALSLGFMETIKQHRFSLNYLIGFTDYIDEGTYTPYWEPDSGYPFYTLIHHNNNYPHYMTGHRLGHGIMMTYDYMLSKHIALGAEITFLIGSIDKLNSQTESSTETFDLHHPIVLNRLSPKIGIRYYF